MSTLYWLTVLGELKNFLFIITIIPSIVAAIIFMVYLANFDNFDAEETRSLCKKIPVALHVNNFCLTPSFGVHPL